jgi:hypothetical protein
VRQHVRHHLRAHQRDRQRHAHRANSADDGRQSEHEHVLHQQWRVRRRWHWVHSDAV